MSDPTQPNEPVPPLDPTRQMPTSAPTPPPTEQQRTTTTRTEPVGPPPESGGLGGGAVAAIAIGAAALALLIGFLVWGQDDDDGDDLSTDTATSVPEDTAPEDTTADNTDEVAGLESQISDLESQLGDVTGERDDLQGQLDDITEGMIELDNVEGMSIDDVRDLASENGWELVEIEPDGAADDAETDTVLSQSPSAGTTMIEGSLLLVEVVPS